MGRFGTAAREGLDVESGTELAGRGAADDHRAHRAVVAGSLQAVQQFIDHRFDHGIDRRTVEQNLGDVIGDLILDVRHGVGSDG